MNKVLKTGFLFYGLTTCVIGRCKQILTYLLLSADASLDIASLTKTTNLHLWTVTAYWRLIILSWANSRLGVPDRLDCQGWLNLPDILVFVLLCILKKSFQVLISLGDFLLKKPKGAALWSDVYPLLFQGFLTLASWAILCSGLRKKKYVSGLLWGALSGEESNCDSLMVYVNCCFRIFQDIDLYWIF